ncbi:hypothetical protein [Streptomyces canus]|uniref:hypothetical protein n=1 Tax=Streptomyces canus TaxID=58343 RepID=UPI00371750B7
MAFQRQQFALSVGGQGSRLAGDRRKGLDARLLLGQPAGELADRIHVATGVHEHVQKREGFLFGRLDAEVHRAERDAGDGASGVAELAVLHGVPCRCAAHAAAGGGCHRPPNKPDVMAYLSAPT